MSFVIWRATAKTHCMASNPPAAPEGKVRKKLGRFLSVRLSIHPSQERVALHRALGTLLEIPKALLAGVSEPGGIWVVSLTYHRGTACLLEPLLPQ